MAEEEEEVKGGWTLIDGPLTNPFSCQGEEGVLLACTDDTVIFMGFKHWAFLR